jgi:hypothetical protein
LEVTGQLKLLRSHQTITAWAQKVAVDWDRDVQFEEANIKGCEHYMNG